MNEKVKRVRLACTLSWIALIYSLGPKLPKVGTLRNATTDFVDYLIVHAIFVQM
jgi:hypothetical protein